MFGLLLVLLAVPGVAAAGKVKGDDIGFRFSANRGSSFCPAAGPCTPAFARLDGLITITPRPSGGERIELSRLSGTIRIGFSPFAKTDKKLTVATPGPVSSGTFEAHPTYGACIDSPLGSTPEELESLGVGINQYYWSDGWSARTVVGLKAGRSTESGELAWWRQDFCQ